MLHIPIGYVRRTDPTTKEKAIGFTKNNKNKNKKLKPRHLKEEDVNKYEKPCQVVLLRKLTEERRSIPSTIYGFPQG